MDIDPPLYINSEDDEGCSYIAPLLTCGHHGKPTFDRSSLWDFPGDAWICPECGQERQMDLRVQILLIKGWETEPPM